MVDRPPSPPLSPLQQRLQHKGSLKDDSDVEISNGDGMEGLPLSRTSSFGSACSVDDMERLDIDDEIFKATSPLVGFVELGAGSASISEVESSNEAWPLHERFPPSFENDGAATTIQQWLRNYWRIAKVLRELTKPEFLEAAKRLFGHCDGSTRDDGGLSVRVAQASSTAEAIRLTSTPAAAKDATTVLMGLPRDAVLRKLPVALHGPRAFLSAALLVSKPSAVLGDHYDTLEGRSLLNASRMSMSACRQLVACIVNQERAGTGRLKRFRARLIMARFARRYHAVTFGAWRACDAHRVAAGLIGPYAECFGAILQAQFTGDSQLAAAATPRAEQIRRKITELIGAKAATTKLQEVEAAVRAQFGEAVQQQQQQQRRVASATASTVESSVKNVAAPKKIKQKSSSSQGLKKGFLNTASSSASSSSSSSSPNSVTSTATTASNFKAAPEKAIAPSAKPVPSARLPEIDPSVWAELPEEIKKEIMADSGDTAVAAALEESLLNEQYAHELIMEPAFQLPPLDEPNPFRPPRSSDFQATNLKTPGALGKKHVSQQEAMAEVQKTMQAMFWERLVTSLTPTTQERPEDLKVGTIAQARYGGAEGSYYAAEIVAVHDDGGDAKTRTFDIKYLQDGVTEHRCPLSTFRLASERVDARPILTLINEVRERLERATPRCTELHARYREVLDAPWLTQMLSTGSLELAGMVRFAHFLLDAVEGLEAPARAERTRNFKAAFTAYVLTPPPPQSSSSLSPGLVHGISPFVAALPQLFIFLHAALDQLQRDMVNFQLCMIAPRLRGAAGVAYEREHFDAKVAKGITSLQKTQLWITGAVKSFIEAGMVGSENIYGKRRVALAGTATSAPLSKTCEECVVHAFVELVRKDVRWDSESAIQLIPETLVLDAVRLAKVRDLLDRAILVSTFLVFFQQVLAKRRIIPAADLVEGLRKKLDFLLTQPDTRLPSLQQHIIEAATTAYAARSLVLDEDDKSSLRHLVSSAASPTNSVFALFTKRAFKLLESMMLACPMVDAVSSDAAGEVGANARHIDDKLAYVQLRAGLRPNRLDNNAQEGFALAKAPGGRLLERALDADLRSTGLKSFRGIILEAGRAMFQLAKHNYAVFGSYYATMCKEEATAMAESP